MANWNPGTPPGPPPPPGGFGGGPGNFGPQPPYGPDGGLPGPPPPFVGSFALGFCAGFFGGCIGAILVHFLAKGSETKRGAGIGFVVQIVIGGAARMLAR